MTAPWPHTAVILAGGGSRRMGARKEHIVLASGQPMVEAVAQVLRTISDRLLVVGPDDVLPNVPAFCEPERIGPLGAIAALLARGADSRYLICPCDMPYLTTEVLRALVAVDAPVAAVLVNGDPAPRPLPLVVADSAAPSVQTTLARGERSLRAWLQSVEVGTVAVPAAEAEQVLRNVNAPEDLRQRDGR